MGEGEASFCPNALLPIEAPLCKLDQFLCNDGSCTPYTDVCNGRWDCKNGDEEEAFCETFPTQERPGQVKFLSTVGR